MQLYEKIVLNKNFLKKNWILDLCNIELITLV